MATPRDFFVNLFVKRPARKRTYADLLARLEKGDARIRSRIARATPGAGNSSVLRHITGIERWSQRRLRTILGEPPIADESDGYQPDPGTDWPALRDEWIATRQETIALARQIAAAGINDGTTATHNSLSNLTGREWLVYLSAHANLEALRVR
jgi:hypothetical protein